MEIVARMLYFGTGWMRVVRWRELCLHFALEAFLIYFVKVLLHHDAEEHAVKFRFELCFGRMIFRVVQVPE